MSWSTPRKAVALIPGLAALEWRAHGPASRLRRHHDRQLRHTVRDALRSEVGRAQLGDRAVGSVADLRTIPTIDKSVIKVAPERAWTSPELPVGTRIQWSTGTTGEPLGIPYPPIAAWRQGIVAVHVTRIQRAPWRLRYRLVDAATADDLDPRDPAHFARQIERRRPRAVFGHAQELIQVGRALGHAHHPDHVGTHGEVLTPESRAEIRELFDVEPTDVYGLSELGRVASQCRARDLYHVHHETLLVEVLDEHGDAVEPGGTGDLVATTLWNPLVPLVRYRTGDRVTLADRPCACGHRQPALASIAGRSMDWFVDADGAPVAPQRLWLSSLGTNELRAAIVRYRVVQDADRSTRVEVVLRRPVSGAAIDHALDRYRSVLGLDVRFVEVPELRVGPTGRFRAFSSSAVPDGVTDR